jgi:hypothetical protein
MDDISKNVDFRVFREVAGAMDLDVPLTIQAEAVEPHAVLLGIDQQLDPVAELAQAFGVQPAFEDRVLHPFAEVLERVSQTRASTIARNIIGHHDQHGNRNGSY